MGLDVSHDCWRGAYSSFNRWRDKLAEVAGYTFSEVEYRYGKRAVVDIDWGCIQGVIGDDLFGEWPALPVRPDGTPDPLIILLAHSDCEGEIQAKFVGSLADRLEQLLPALGDEDGGGHIGSYREKTQQFIDGLRAASAAGDSVEFA